LRGPAPAALPVVDYPASPPRLTLDISFGDLGSGKSSATDGMPAPRGKSTTWETVVRGDLHPELLAALASGPGPQPGDSAAASAAQDPEPVSYALLMAGVAGLVASRRQLRRFMPVVVAGLAGGLPARPASPERPAYCRSQSLSS
jgi:hypothetical protein